MVDLDSVLLDALWGLSGLVPETKNNSILEMGIAMLRTSSSLAGRMLTSALKSVVNTARPGKPQRRRPSPLAGFEQLEARCIPSVNVSTYHYDNSRDGANTNETILTPANVNTTTFGKVASFAVDGQVYAQPLVETNVPVAGQGTRNIVLVATENDSVYAFDAQGNNPAQGYLWKTSLLQPGETTIPETDYGTTDIIPQIGITGTPVVDPTTNTLYVVGAFKESNATYQQRLYALDITSGAPKFGGPETIAASVPGTGSGSSGGTLTFSAFIENQRPALTLANGQVYIGWSSHGDLFNWHGWLIAYNAATLARDYVYCTTPNGGEGGIWMSGGGISVDASGDLYFSTGNGTFDANTGGKDYSMAVEKMSPSLGILDYFSPYNESSLSNADLDYGCSSVVLLPPQSGSFPDEFLSAGKWGTLFLNDSDTGSLGEFTTNGPNKDLGQANSESTTNQAVLHNAISYWNGYAYIGSDNVQLQAFSVSGGTLGTTASSKSSNVFGTGGLDGQGCNPTISSNGTSNGIVWAVDNSGFNSKSAVLYAYNANNLSQMLWSSSQAAGGRDTCGNAVKFQGAVVANGYVYVGGANSVTVYGLLPALAGLPAVNGSSTAINLVSATGNGTTATITTGAPHGFWVGELVTLTGTTPGGPGGLAGAVRVTGVPSATSFQFASTYNASQTLSGATVAAALAGAQRSMVDSIVYNFTEPVTLTAGAFSISVVVDNTNTGDEAGVAPTLNVAPVPFTNELVVTFTDPVNGSVIGNSIANGAYSISINPASVAAVSNGQHLIAGETDTFYRLFGDVTGAESVTNVDANAFNRAWGNTYYSVGYNAALDYNDDGKFTNIDANAFNRAFNKRYQVTTTI